MSILRRVLQKPSTPPMAAWLETLSENQLSLSAHIQGYDTSDAGKWSCAVSAYGLSHLIPTTYYNVYPKWITAPITLSTLSKYNHDFLALYEMDGIWDKFPGHAMLVWQYQRRRYLLQSYIEQYPVYVEELSPYKSQLLDKWARSDLIMTPRFQWEWWRLTGVRLDPYAGPLPAAKITKHIVFP